MPVLTPMDLPKVPVDKKKLKVIKNVVLEKQGSRTNL
jgi:hypothetical protein